MSSEAKAKLLKYFNSLYQGPMNRVDAYSADFSQRIASISRFLVREANRFYDRMSPEGRASYDPEDVILELWIALKERDHKFDSGRGTYLHFAQSVTRNCLYELGERARVVKMAANQAPTLKADLSHVFEAADIAYLEMRLRPSRDHDFIPSGLPDQRARPPIEQDIHEENMELSRDTVVEFLNGLTLFECIALGAYVGLWGDDPQNTVKAKAQQYNTSSYALGRALMTARIKLRLYLENKE